MGDSSEREGQMIFNFNFLDGLELGNIEGIFEVIIPQENIEVAENIDENINISGGCEEDGILNTPNVTLGPADITDFGGNNESENITNNDEGIISHIEHSVNNYVQQLDDPLDDHFDENRNTENDQTAPNNKRAHDDDILNFETPKRKRSRLHRPQTDKWKRNIRREKIVKGEAHDHNKESKKKKMDTVPSKRCVHIDCKCKRKCSTLISAHQQKSTFDEYYAMKSRQDQRFYLAKLIKERPIKRRIIPADDCQIIRNQTSAFYLKNEVGETVRVCRLFFTKTFDISKKIPQNIVKKLSPTTGIYNPDHGNKGRAPKNKTDELKIRKVKTFINKFPKVPSHYCRKNSSKLYFYPEMSLVKLYTMYCEATPEADVVKKHVFTDVFRNYEPPLAFFQPKKDQCTKCNTKLPEADYNQHVERKEAIYAAKANDKSTAQEQSGVVYATFDMEAVQCLPFCQDSSWYYKRKLSLYNFTIWDTNGNGLCNVWEEVNGAKSSVEVTSCILDYLSTLPATTKHVIFYCDTCGGQNRNFNIVCALFYFINSKQFNLPNIETVDLKYCESGHSYIEADSMHSAIENGRKNVKCYLPNDYHNIMKVARKNPKPYNVQPLTFKDFYDVRGLAKKFFVNRKKDTKKTKRIHWLNVKVFRFVQNSQFLLFKYDVRAENFEQEIILRNKVDISDFDSFSLQKNAYSELLPISIAKKRDLLDMVKEGVIPQVYKSYYESLPASKKVKDIALWVTGSIGPQEELDFETQKEDDDEYDVIECEEIEAESSDSDSELSDSQ